MRNIHAVLMQFERYFTLSAVETIPAARKLLQLYDSATSEERRAVEHVAPSSSRLLED